MQQCAAAAGGQQGGPSGSGLALGGVCVPAWGSWLGDNARGCLLRLSGEQAFRWLAGG